MKKKMNFKKYQPSGIKIFTNRHSSSYPLVSSIECDALMRFWKISLWRFMGRLGFCQQSGGKVVAFLTPFHSNPSTTGGANRGAKAYWIPKYALIFWVRYIFKYVPITIPWPGICIGGASRALTTVKICTKGNDKHINKNFNITDIFISMVNSFHSLHFFYFPFTCGTHQY